MDNGKAELVLIGQIVTCLSYTKSIRTFRYNTSYCKTSSCLDLDFSIMLFPFLCGITTGDILNFINLATLFVEITKFVND
jgi:hypothetical protein